MSKSNTPLEQFILMLTWIAIFFLATRLPVDPDMWWHLRAGNEMWDQGRILLNDVFSYTRLGSPWINVFWISDLGLYGLWKIGGFFAITIFTALMAVAVMSIVYAQMEGRCYLRTALILLAMFGALANWSARPQLMSFALLAFLDFFLRRHFFVKRQPLWILVLIFALWGNLHGGFIWGILLLAATIVGEILNIIFGNESARLNWHEVHDLAVWSAAGGLAVMINPNGASLWRLPFYQIQVSLIAIDEWLSPDFHQFYAHPLLWLLFLLIFGVSFSKKRISFVDLFKALGFTYMLFVAQRNMGPYAIIIAPIVARHLADALDTLLESPVIRNWFARRNQNHANISSKLLPAKGVFIINSLVASLLTVFALTNAYFISSQSSIDSSVPARAVQWIKDNQPRGPMFNSYNWGGYLIWELRDYPVFIDGRADLYGDEILSEWNEIVNGTEKGLAILDTRKINLVFLEPKYPLLERLSEHGWEKTFSDSRITIYRRQPPMP